MMCREMLVLEEKELVCVEVKGKMKREREGESGGGGAWRDRKRMGVTEKVWICERVFAYIFMHMTM